jgi:hypothetical protein
MDNKPKKYVFVNGVMMLNPEFTALQSPAPSAPAPQQNTQHQNTTPPPPPQQLAVVCCQNDLQIANEIQAPSATPVQLSSSTYAAIEVMQESGYGQQFGISDNGNLFDELSNYFMQYEVPVGLLSKLMLLRSYRLNFMVDDSGSYYFMYRICMYVLYIIWK